MSAVGLARCPYHRAVTGTDGARTEATSTADRLVDTGRAGDHAGSRIHVSFTAVLGLVASVLAALVVVNVFEAAHRTVGWVIACTVVAVLVSPIIDTIDRYVPRAVAVLVTFVGGFALVASLWAGVFNDVRGEVDDLKRDAPRAAESIEERSELAREFRLAERVQGVVDALDERVGGTEEVLVQTAGTVPTYVVTGVLTLFLLVYGKRYFEGGLERIDDDDRRAHWRGVVTRSIRRGRRYVLFALAEAVVIGAVAYGVARVLELDGALVLAVIAGGLSVIPIIGIVVGSVPLLLVAAGFEPVSTAVFLGGLFLLLQLLDAVVVWRRVDRLTVEVGPAVFVVVWLVGFDLYGVGGAVYGVILAVFGVALLDTLAGVSAAVELDVASADPARGPDPDSAPDD